MQGVQGTQGPQGDQGFDGVQGVQGFDGMQGVQGTQGPQGTQGTQGFQGLQGLQGNQGAQGAQGEQGAQGIQGIQGLQGLQGNQGPDGIFIVSETAPSSPTEGTVWFNCVTGREFIWYDNYWVESGTSWVSIGSQGLQGLQGPQSSLSIANASDNRVLTSDGTSSGINAEANLTFTGSLMTVTGNLQVTGQAWSTIDSNGNASGTIGVDFNTSNVQTYTLTGDVTFTFSNPNPGATYIIIVKQSAAGSNTVGWPLTVKWAGASAPTQTTTANRYDVYTFVYDGTNYYGTYSQNYA